MFRHVVGQLHLQCGPCGQIRRRGSGCSGSHGRFGVFVRSLRRARTSAMRRLASSRLVNAQECIVGGRVDLHSGWYHRRTRRVRHLSCGHARVFLAIEGRRCCQATVKDIAREPDLDWSTIKTIEKPDLGLQLARAELRSCRRAFFPGTFHSYPFGTSCPPGTCPPGNYRVW